VAPRVESRQAAPAPQATFRSVVDVIAVDVQVVDSNGRPMAALSPNQFSVTVDGRNRRVVSAELIEHSDRSAVAGPVRPIGSGPTATNLWPTTGDGRTFIIAFDASSLEAGEALPVVNALRDFLNRLSPADRVGVFSLRTGSSQIDPSTDRAAVRRALDALAGQKQSLPGQFNLSTSEIIDIASETAGFSMFAGSSAPTSSAPATGRAGTPPTIVAAPAATDSNTMQRVANRECRRTTDLGCIEAIFSEASALSHYLEDRATQTLNGITDLLRALGEYPGRKTVIVMSGGIATSDRPGGRLDIGSEARLLGEQAAHANAVVYAVHVDTNLGENFSAQQRRGARVDVARARAPHRVARARRVLERVGWHAAHRAGRPRRHRARSGAARDVRVLPAGRRARGHGSRRPHAQAVREGQRQGRHDPEPQLGRPAQTDGDPVPLVSTCLRALT
jgi:VWFA-related protein